MFKELGEVGRIKRQSQRDIADTIGRVAQQLAGDVHNASFEMRTRRLTGYLVDGIAQVRGMDTQLIREVFDVKHAGLPTLQQVIEVLFYFPQVVLKDFLLARMQVGRALGLCCRDVVHHQTTQLAVVRFQDGTL